MIDTKTLMIGNYVNHSEFGVVDVWGVNLECVQVVHKDTIYFTELFECESITLTEQWLLDFNFTKPPHFTVDNSYSITISRNRKLIVSSVGTPNLMVALCTVDDAGIGTDIIVLHNWDYDKEIYVHNLQNIYHVVSKQQLTLKK